MCSHSLTEDGEVYGYGAGLRLWQISGGVAMLEESSHGDGCCAHGEEREEGCVLGKGRGTW